MRGWPSSASPTMPGSCIGTIARSRAASTAWSRSACSSMSACASTRRCSARSSAAARRRGGAGALDWPGADPAPPTPGSRSTSSRAATSRPVAGAALDRAQRALGHRHRDPAPALRPHAAPVARAFAADWDRAAALYDERFCRMWEYYLATSEVSFRYLDNMNFQIQLAPDRYTLPSPATTCSKRTAPPRCRGCWSGRLAGGGRRAGGTVARGQRHRTARHGRRPAQWEAGRPAAWLPGVLVRLALSSAPWPRRACAWSPPTCAATTCLPSPRAFPPTCWTSWPTTSWAWPMPWATAGSPSSAMTGAACWPGTWPRVTPAASSARPSLTHPTPPPCATSLPGTRASSPAAGTSPFSSCPACPSACCAPATTPGSPTASPAPAVPARSATPTSPTTAAPGRSPAHSPRCLPGTVRCACSSRQRRPCGSRSRSR